MYVLGTAGIVIASLVLLFIFFFGLASGDRDNGLWNASWMFLVFLFVCIGMVVYSISHRYEGYTTPEDANHHLYDTNYQDHLDMQEDMENDTTHY